MEKESVDDPAKIQRSQSEKYLAISNPVQPSIPAVPHERINNRLRIRPETEWV